LKLAFIRPDAAHLWSGITSDHFRTRYDACVIAKAFSGQKKSLRGINHPERSEIDRITLANLGAEESAVIFDANLTAAEKISHRGDSLLGVLRAGADREDQVTERKLRPWLEDLGILFHNLAQLDSS
jgi:hypothetical protein